MSKEERTAIDIQAVRQSLNEYIATTGKTQAEIARSVGVSDSRISQFRKGTYTGDNESLAYSLQQMMNLDTRRQQTVKKPGFVVTSTAKEVMTVARYTHEHTDIGVIYGPAGIGKTMALKQYAQEYPSTVFITADVTTARAKALLEEIADKIGTKSSGTQSAIKRGIISELNRSGRMIIIDEAQHLAYEALEALRTIMHDTCGTGVLLCGNEVIYSNMIGKRNAPFAQLFSRVGISRGLSKKVSLEDIRKIVCQDLPVTEECVQYFHSVANSPGGIRLAVKLFVLAWETANRINEPISLDILTSASEFLMQHS